MKKLFTTAAIFLAVSALSAQDMYGNPSGNKIVGVDQVVAIVEDTTITQEDIMRGLAPFMKKLYSESANQADFNKRIKQQSDEVLQNLIDRVIIVKEFENKGYMIPQSKLDSLFEDDLQNNFNGDRSQFLKYLQSQNKTIKQYHKELKESFIVVQMYAMQRKSASEVSPAQIINYYNDNKQKWYAPARVMFRQISITDKSPEALKEKVENIHAELKAGADFAALAKKYSQDEYAKNGGLSTWYSKGQFSPEAEKTIFALSPGELSEPIIMSNYAFIWKLEEKKPEGIQPLDDVREQIEETIITDNMNIEYQKWLDRLRKKAYIRYY